MEKEIHHDKKKLRKRTIKELFVFLVFNVIFLAILMAFALWWQDQTDLKAFADGIWLVFAFQLTISWSLFVYNENIFTPLVHGVKTFFLIFIGQKPKEDYYTYYTKIKDNPIPNGYIWIGFILTLIVLMIGIMLTLEVYP
jgi:hypothetical protein